MRRIVTVLAVAGIQIGVLGGAPWRVQAQEQTSGQTAKAAETETEKAADRKFQEGLNNLGLSAGYAYKCSEKESAERQLIGKQALETGNQMMRYFGTNAVLEFAAYMGAGAAGSGLEAAKCAQYVTDWQNFTKKHPEINSVK